MTMSSTRNTDSGGGHKPLRRRLSHKRSDLRRKHGHLKFGKLGNRGENGFGFVVDNVETIFVGIFFGHLESSIITTGGGGRARTGR